MRVAIQGERGAFSDEAARRLCARAGASAATVTCCASFEEVFRRLREGRVAWAVIPIENTLAGSVGVNYDLLRREAAWICAETNLRIAHQLILHPRARPAGVRRVISHPVALDQCRKFLRRHPRWAVEAVYDTAGAVKQVMERELLDTAAIAGVAAAEAYGGRVLARNIEDHKRNFTRFFLLRRGGGRSGRGSPRGTAPATTETAKISLVFTTRNRPGTLYRCLAAFATRSISLTRIESRPAPGRPWEYSFYLDLLGHLKEKGVVAALSELKSAADEVKILGCYPAMETDD